jgi:general secretion pathway protein C
MTGDLLTPRRAALLTWALGAALVAAVLVLAGDALKLAVRPSGRADNGRTGAQVPAAPDVSPLERYEPLLKRNLFGFPPAELVPLGPGEGEAVGQAGPAAATGGELTVAGTVAWADGFGYAVVLSGEGQELYKRGDHIPGAGKLSRVRPTGITIEGDGRSVEVPVADLAEVVDVSAPQPQARGKTKSAGKTFARQTSSDTYLIDRSGVEESLSNPKRMLTDARLLPNIVDGKQEGFVMSEVRPGGLYDTLGLRNGDVLLRVNDFDISSAESGLQAFTALRGMDRIKLDIKRGGRVESLTYLIR